MVDASYSRDRQRKDYRNGCYWRNFVTLLDADVADCADAEEEFSAGGDPEISTASGGGVFADLGGLFISNLFITALAPRGSGHTIGVNLLGRNRAV